MKSHLRCLVLLWALSTLSTILSEQSSTPQRPAAPALNEELEFAAIQAIHGQLDDNADGSVDLSESSEFVQTELCGDSLEGRQACWSSDKSKQFHQKDKHITSMELWSTWHKNKVINWSTNDVVSWLENTVHLSQYSDVFRNHKITGRHLPQIAVNTNQFLQTTLLVNNSKHKQKIQLRAMDVILFGPPVGSGYWKDALLVLSIALSICGVVYALRQRQTAQRKIDSFLEDFRIKEEELSKLKAKLESEKALDEAVGENSTDSVPTPPSDEDSLPSVFSRSTPLETTSPLLSQIQEENHSLRSQLQALETQYSYKISKLRGLLQDCCKKEWSHLDSKRKAAEDQMSRAQKVCDKIKKRRYSLFGSFHLANSSALEEAGLQITKAVNKMHSISECFDEYHLRWEQIEHVCGYPIISSADSTPALSSLAHLDSTLVLTREGSPFSIGSTSTITSNTQSTKPQKGRRNSSTSSRLSMDTTSVDTPESRLNCQYGSVNLMDAMSESEPDLGMMRFSRNQPSQLIHSNSMPIFRRGLPEAPDSKSVEANGDSSLDKTVTKGLQPIQEEKSSSPVIQRRTRIFTLKSKSSEV